MKLKPVAETDFQRLTDLCRQTFYESWIEPGNESDLLAYMDHYFDADFVKGELADPDILYVIIRDEDGEDAGYLKLETGAQPENYPLDQPVALHRLYIKRKFQNKGMGRELVNYAIEFAKTKDFKTLWLGVWNENHNAIRFYKTFGFEIFGNYKFVMGTIVSDDYLMKVIL